MFHATALRDDAALRALRPKTFTGSAFDLTAIRIIDITLASLALFFIAPLLLLLGAMIVIADGGPAFFGHRRLGKDGRYFSCLKLRTMHVDSAERLRDILAASPAARAEWARDHKLREDPRVTPIGRFLRRTSMDELPQLINVIRGEMSIVGPRPIVEGEIGRYGHYIRDYCAVRPGLTGLWQVSGRNDVSYRRRVALDVVYCRAKSLTLDLKIIAMTIPAILSGDGCY